MIMGYVKNEDLKLEEIPKVIEEGGLQFAHSFNGYEFSGSFQGCADISKKVRDAIKENSTEELTLSEIRTSLFFYFRAVRHGGGESNKPWANELLNLIRLRVKNNKLE